MNPGGRECFLGVLITYLLDEAGLFADEAPDDTGDDWSYQDEASEIWEWHRITGTSNHRDHRITGTEGAIWE